MPRDSNSRLPMPARERRDSRTSVSGESCDSEKAVFALVAELNALETYCTLYLFMPPTRADRDGDRATNCDAQRIAGQRWPRLERATR